MVYPTKFVGFRNKNFKPHKKERKCGMRQLFVLPIWVQSEVELMESNILAGCTRVSKTRYIDKDP